MKIMKNKEKEKAIEIIDEIWELIQINTEQKTVQIILDKLIELEEIIDD